VSLDDPGQPMWSELANDIVVNEKTVSENWVHARGLLSSIVQHCVLDAPLVCVCVVVQLVGSRCGPMHVALRFMAQHAEVRQLLKRMLQHEVSLTNGVAAMSLAATKGVLKVQLIMPNATTH
jgi:hypothetical protein